MEARQNPSTSAANSASTTVPAPELNRRSALDCLRTLEWLLGGDWLKDRLRSFGKRLAGWQGRPFAVWSEPELHPLIPGLWQLDTWRDKGMPGSIPEEVKLVAEHASYVNHLLGEVAEPDKARTRDYLRSRLRDDKCAAALFEIRTTVGFMFRGYRARWLSPVNEDSHDVEVYTPHIVAVECKCQGVGAGRKIPNLLFNRLVGEISRIGSIAQWEYGIVIEPGNRLEPSDVPELISRVETILRNNEEGIVSLRLKGGEYLLTARKLCSRKNKLTRSEARSIIDRLTPDGPGGIHVALGDVSLMSDLGGDGPVVQQNALVNPAVLIAKSRQPDHVLRQLVELAGDAAKRLPEDTPGIAAVHIPEFIDWERLSKDGPMGLDRAVTQEFRGETRRHVSLISFSAENGERRLVTLE